MLTILFFTALIWVAWKMLVLGIKAAWGVTKVLCAAFLLPAFLFGLICVGLLYVAIPILVIVVIVALFGKLIEA